MAGSGGEADLGAVFQFLNAACQGQLSVAALAEQLDSLGAFRGTGTASPLARFSRHVLDKLPKLFTASGEGGGGGETVGDQLRSKQEAHSVLLQLLADSGCLARLHPATLRCLFEDGQRLQALTDVRDLENKLAEAAGARPRATGGAAAAEAAFPLRDVIVAAGQRCMGAVQGGGDRSPWEVFYACPSLTSAAFFLEAAAAADRLGGGGLGGPAAAALDAAAQIARGVAAALGGAAAQRGAQQQWYPAAMNAAAAGVAAPEWTACEGVRAALSSLAVAAMALGGTLASEAPSRLPDAAALLSDVAERLLNAFAAALAAADPSARRRIKGDYDEARDATLAYLLEAAVAACRSGAGWGEAQMQRVEALAEGHHGYGQLMEVAELLGDRERLYSHMTSLRGDALTEPMATYVFARLLREGRAGELLDLPQQFDAELREWLAAPEGAAPDPAARLRLRWLHDVRVCDYAGAVGSLAELAAAGAAAGGGGGGGGAATRRLLSLQKLAAMAASPEWPAAPAPGVAAALRDAERQLALTALALRLGLHTTDGSTGGSTSGGTAALDVAQLVEAALAPGRSPEDALAALEAFAFADPQFQIEHRAVQGVAWQRLASASDWAALAAERPQLSDRQFHARVAAQPLYRAAAACYGPGPALPRQPIPAAQVAAQLAAGAQAAGLAPEAAECLLLAFQAGCSAPAGVPLDDAEGGSGGGTAMVS